jgi:hypothetical protein
MSNQAIPISNQRNPRINRLPRINNIFNCLIHGSISSIHKRCPKCYRDRMNQYSSLIRNRNIIPRPPNTTRRPDIIRIINNQSIRPYSAPAINSQNTRNIYNFRLPSIRENRRTTLITNRTSMRNSSNSQSIRNQSLPFLLNNNHLHNNLPNTPNRILRDNNLNEALRIQNLLTEEDIINISLRDRHETPVNLHVLSRDTSICNAPCIGNCAICQEDWENNEVVRKLPCEHVFHIMCIDKWFSENNVCPVCRYSMPAS